MGGNALADYKWGNGPLESMTPCNLHWGLVEPGFSATHGITDACMGPGVAIHKSPGVAMILCDDVACHYKLGNGPFASMTPGDLHWGLVEPNCAVPYSTAALCSGPGAVACQYLQCGFVESSFSFLPLYNLDIFGPWSGLSQWLWSSLATALSFDMPSQIGKWTPRVHDPW